VRSGDRHPAAVTNVIYDSKYDSHISSFHLTSKLKSVP
jgi:hypothetical protein